MARNVSYQELVKQIQGIKPDFDFAKLKKVASKAATFGARDLAKFMGKGLFSDLRAPIYQSASHDTISEWALRAQNSLTRTDWRDDAEEIIPSFRKIVKDLKIKEYSRATQGRITYNLNDIIKALGITNTPAASDLQTKVANQAPKLAKGAVLDNWIDFMHNIKQPKWENTLIGCLSNDIKADKRTQDTVKAYKAPEDQKKGEKLNLGDEYAGALDKNYNPRSFGEVAQAIEKYANERAAVRGERVSIVFNDLFKTDAGHIVRGQSTGIFSGNDLKTVEDTLLKRAQRCLNYEKYKDNLEKFVKGNYPLQAFYIREMFHNLGMQYQNTASRTYPKEVQGLEKQFGLKVDSGIIGPQVRGVLQQNGWKDILAYIEDMKAFQTYLGVTPNGIFDDATAQAAQQQGIANVVEWKKKKARIDASRAELASQGSINQGIKMPEPTLSLPSDKPGSGLALRTPAPTTGNPRDLLTKRQQRQLDKQAQQNATVAENIKKEMNAIRSLFERVDKYFEKDDFIL